ncbi:MAG TPA: AAA family ATPase, partial [Lacipirellula sp.]
DAAVRQVTFHPSFSYEDFVEGFRPNAEGKFHLHQGIFRQICQAAAADPGRPFLLIIDELNRGDVARIFGELITLIEPDKRDSNAQAVLPYSHTKFTVPGNLHILGTMNTADRSISLLDIAIRRRFCFIEFAPDPAVIDTSSDHLSEIDGLRLSTLLRAINERLLLIGVDRDRSLGHSHLLIANNGRAPIDVLRERIQYDIAPLIEEYCYANRSLMAQVLDRLVTADGAVRPDVLNDDQKLVRALKHLCNDGSSTAVSGPLAEVASAVTHEN